jgi:hypothetical protein
MSTQRFVLQYEEGQDVAGKSFNYRKVRKVYARDRAHLGRHGGACNKIAPLVRLIAVKHFKMTQPHPPIVATPLTLREILRRATDGLASDRLLKKLSANRLWSNISNGTLWEVLRDAGVYPLPAAALDNHCIWEGGLLLARGDDPKYREAIGREVDRKTRRGYKTQDLATRAIINQETGRLSTNYRDETHTKRLVAAKALTRVGLSNDVLTDGERETLREIAAPSIPALMTENPKPPET